MSEKRRLSTRNRGEPPLKKRALSPPPPPPVFSAPPPPPTEPMKDGLPLRLKEGRHLPAKSDMQDPNLESRSYQSIPESGVLSASIERSRQRWQPDGFADGIFDRYWAKPSKKRDMSHTPNPAKETMTRLGVCSMIIEPHVFEVTLYTVKDLPPSFNAISSQPPSLSAPQYNPFAQNTAYAPPPYNTPPPGSASSHNTLHHGHPPQYSLPPFKEGFGSFGLQGPPPIYHPPVRPPPPIQPPAPAAASYPPSLPKAVSNDRNVAQGENGEPKTDPVIQMLATRAAKNDHLKELMKVVASGKASQTQLREFQDHIDELNSIIKSRPNSPPSLGKDGDIDGPPPPPPPPPASRQPSSSTDQFFRSNLSWMPNSTVASHPATHTSLPSIKMEPQTSSYHVATPPPIAKPSSINGNDVHGVVFDFGGSGDRFSIPKFSILEYLYSGTQVIVSFLVVRRGNTAVSGNYKANASYYQPVTIRLTTPHPKILEPLSRIVAPPDQVRRYMNNIFDQSNPAETVYLATRLPRSIDFDEEKQETVTQPDFLTTRPVYAPPDSIMPLAA